MVERVEKLLESAGSGSGRELCQVSEPTPRGCGAHIEANAEQMLCLAARIS